jgi:exonuclease SbcC
LVVRHGSFVIGHWSFVKFIMRIISLDIENAKSYRQAHIDFTEGVNAIVGRNGAGKSTIVEAIGFALFDWLAYKHKDFVREGEKSATITVAFISSADERRYEVVRRIGGGNQYYVYDPELGGKVCGGKADVLAFLRQNMGVEPGADLSRLFSDAVGVPQGSFTAAFLLTPAGRKSTFDPLLQVEEYKRAYDKLREPLSLLRGQQQTLEVEIAGLAARLEQLPPLEAAVRKRAKELKEAEAGLASTAAELAETEEARTALETQVRFINRLRQEKATMAAQLAAGEEQLTSARQALEAALEAQALVAQHRPGHDAYVEAQAQQRTLEQQAQARQTLRDRVAKAEQRLALARKESQTIDEALAGIAKAEEEMARLAPMVKEQERLESELQAARQDHARLQAARRQLSQHEQVLTRLQKRAKTLAGELAKSAELETDRARLEGEIETRQTQLDERREAQAGYKTEAESLKKQSAALEEADIQDAACPVCEQPLTETHRADILQRNAARLEALRQAYAEAQRQMQADDAALAKLKRQLRQTQQALLKLPRSSELDEMQAEIERAQTTLEESRAAVDELAATPARIETLQTKLADLDDPKQAHAIARDQVRRKGTREARRGAIQEEIAGIQATLDELRAQLDAFADLDAARAEVRQALETHVEAYQLVLGNRQVAESVEARQAKVEQVQAQRAALFQQLTQVSEQLAQAEAEFDAEAYTQLLGREQQLRNEQAALQTRLSLLRSAQERDEAQLAMLRKQAARLGSLRAHKETLAEQGAILEALRRVLRDAGPYITGTLIRQISEGAARIFGDIMQDYSRHLSWDETYEIQLNVNGNERAFAQLSGGEQMSAALALRLALLREMSAIDIAFFDEPTTNLDEARREALASQILEVKGLRQLFVISHDDAFEQATQHLIRIERVGGESRVAVEE